MTIEKAIEEFGANGIVMEMKGNGSVEPQFVKVEEINDLDKHALLRPYEDRDIAECCNEFEQAIKDMGLKIQDITLVSDWEYFDKDSEYIADSDCMYRFWF